ncbi:hypothetical protein HYV89_04870 [Candidatus Woesearchaeota archaeon]|nr:hypothetical protein [Candidatus Woesearchaeota archaeon]
MSDLKPEGIFGQYHYEKEGVVGHSCDGTGSKIVFDLKHGNLHDSARNLVAMNLDDLSCEYIRPSHFWDTILMGKMNEGLKNRMISSLSCVLNAYNVTLMGGETAILPYQLKEGSVIWDGYVYGKEEDIKRHNFFIDRRTSLEKGLLLCAIPDNKGSLGSNGFTFLHDIPFRNEFIAPCRIYTPQILMARDDSWFFAHITGGGYKNIERILPENLDAIIELRSIPEIFRYVQDKAGFSDKEMFETYHMGSRLIVGTKNAGKLMEIFGNAFVVGELRKGNGRVFVNRIGLDPY